MQSRICPRARRLALLLSLSAVSGCARPDAPPPRNIFPSAVDVKAVTEPKPVPPDAIISDDAVAARYGIDLELWGERLYRAGGRLCRELKARGMDVVCPAPPASQHP